MQTGVGLTSKTIKFTYDTTTGDNTKIDRYLDGLLVLSTTNAYDTHGRLKGITQRNSTGVIAESIYGYDNLNRLISTSKNGQTQTYDYDSTDQVKTVTGGNSEAYTYDSNGNRTGGGYVTAAGNRLMSDGTYRYTYDSEGNRTKRTKIADGTVDTYSWDYRNRLMGIVSKDINGVVTRTVGYAYDVDDQRVSKTINASTGNIVENYYLDGSQIAFVTDGGGNEMFHYLYGLNIDQVLAQDSTTGMISWSEVQDYAYGGLVNTDKFVAGFADKLTGGYTTRLRNEIYGNRVAGQHEGYAFNLGQSVGLATGLVTIGLATGGAGTIAGGLDLGVQLWQNQGDFAQVNLGTIAISAVSGRIGAGVSSGLGKGGTLVAGTAYAERMFGKYKQAPVEKKLPRIVRLDKIQNLDSHRGSHDSSLHYGTNSRTV